MAAAVNIDQPTEDEKQYKSWVGEVFKENDFKPCSLSLQHIVKRHLPPESSEWSHEDIIKELNNIKRVRLDRENLCKIDNCELLNAGVTHLYLHCNKITKIENLECLQNLQVLILSENKICAIEGIEHMKKLTFLDLSNNSIEKLEAEKLPKSIIILNLSGNPCVNDSSYSLPTNKNFLYDSIDQHRKTADFFKKASVFINKPSLIEWLPKLKHLDGAEVLKKETTEDCENSANSDIDDQYPDDENDEEDSDTNLENVSNKNVAEAPDPKKLIGFKQLPEIQTNIHDLATNMLMRSQTRLEERTKEHRRHVQEMTNIKILSKIKPLSSQLKKRHLPD